MRDAPRLESSSGEGMKEGRAERVLKREDLPGGQEMHSHAEQPEPGVAAAKTGPPTIVEIPDHGIGRRQGLARDLVAHAKLLPPRERASLRHAGEPSSDAFG